MFQKELEIAQSLAFEAGKILTDIYKTAFDVAYKSASDPVTEADKRANTFIVNALREHFPHDGVVGEESEDTSDALRKGRCWYVDPLDGTKEFVAKNGEFAVMIGLAVEGRSQVGVVYRPVGEVMYTGAKGHGAHKLFHGERSVLKVSDEHETTKLRMAVSRSHRSSDVQALQVALGITHEVVCGSVGLKVALLTEQQADCYALLSDQACLWDACGPEAILQAAGGHLSDLGGEPIIYGGHDMHLKRGLLACNSSAAEAVLTAVRPIAHRAGFI